MGRRWSDGLNPTYRPELITSLADNSTRVGHLATADNSHIPMSAASVLTRRHRNWWCGGQTGGLTRNGTTPTTSINQGSFCVLVHR
jgi:hypothetical protein